MLKLLAVINVIFGILLFGGSAYSGFNASQAAQPAPTSVLALTVLMGIMGLGFVISAVVFLKNPNQRRALAVARNSAVFTWLSVALSISAGTGSSGPLPFTLAVVAAAVAYFWVFKPAALRQFPNSDENVS